MAVKVRLNKSAVTVALPVEKSKPSTDLGSYNWLIYGDKKIGKTSLAAQFPDALFLMFEPGGKGLEIYQTDMPSWKAFKEIIQLLKSTDRFATVVIDTVDIAYDKCLEFVGQRNGWDHPSEQSDFGKSWQDVKKEFSSTVTELVQTGRGVIFISHAQDKEFKTERGRSYNKYVPTMSKQSASYVTGFVDVIGYYTYQEDARYLLIRGTDTVEAGHRIGNNFKTPEGERIYGIPMGLSAEEGYQNVLRAFNNQQTEVFRPHGVGDPTAPKFKVKSNE